LKYSKKLSRKYKIVIDAKIIISAIFGGYPEKALEIAICHEVFAPITLEKELNRFIEKARKKQEFPHLKEFFNYMLNHVRLITLKKIEQVSRDKSDDFYIAAAIQEGADFLITGDKDLLSCKDLGEWSFKILTPREFIETIRKS
jgi:putative PIN family toxin of toxin-antitoxin system